jgi:hypothetical protein
MDSADKEYAAIKKSGSAGEELLMRLSTFEVNHSSHFASKVDLGSYYLLAGNLPMADYYLRRAESTVSQAGWGGDISKTKTILWGSLAYLRFLEKDYAKASVYVQKAIKQDKDVGKNYLLLNAHILYAKGEQKAALAQFDDVWKTAHESFRSEDLRSYAYLLADADRISESISILGKLFETGEYYSGLGLFASTLSEKAGDKVKAIQYAFLDYLYVRNGDASKDVVFMRQLSVLDEKFKKEKDGIAVRDAVTLVRSYCDATISYSAPDEADSFVARFIKLSNRIRDGKVASRDFSAYLSLEPYFKKFPDYYLSVWKAVKKDSPDQLPQFKMVLEKVLTLGPGTSGALFARKELGSLVGLSENDSKKLLLPIEVELTARNYVETSDSARLKAIVDLLGLPDNSYVLESVVWLKANSAQMGIVPIFRQYITTHNDKAAERMRFILEK